MSNKARRAISSDEVRKIKGELIRSAHIRLKRATKLGFHIEAVAILESLITDRLESLIAISEKNQIDIGNLGPANKINYEAGRISEELHLDLKKWAKDRAKVIHEMVKVSNVIDSDWRERMKFARSTSSEGLRLLKKLDLIVKQYKRNYKS